MTVNECGCGATEGAVQKGGHFIRIRERQQLVVWLGDTKSKAHNSLSKPSTTRMVQTLSAVY
jgi:hypothetical protein